MPSLELVVAISLALVTATWCGAALQRLGFPLPAPGRIGNVDNLRGYLGLSVLCHHYILWTSVKNGGQWDELDIAFYNQLGAGAVGLFFMITGLVFYPRVLAGFRDNSWTSMYIGRFFRIIPLTLFSIALVSLVIAATTPHRPDWRYPLEVASWLSGKMTFDLMAFENSRQVNASVLWSIFYEWLFYIFLLPACSLARLTVGSRTWIVPVSFCIAAYIGRLTDIDAFRYLPLFAVGMIAHELQAYTKLTAALRTSWASLAAAASLLVGMICFPNPYDKALPLFAFFFICVVSGNKFFGLLNTKGSAVMGECSFGIYLLHGILLYILFNETSIEIPAVILLPILSSIVAVTTATTYLLIEVPCIAVGRQMSKKFRPQRGVQSGLPASS